MDERMLKTGTVPVTDQLDRLPAAANGERESTLLPYYVHRLYIQCESNLTSLVKGKAKQEEEEDEEAELEKLRAEMAMG